MTYRAYVANSCRMAALRNLSAASVNLEPLTRPMLIRVRRATGSHNSTETPAPNIAIARCSFESRSVHEMPSIAYLRVELPRNDRACEVKVLLKRHVARSARANRYRPFVWRAKPAPPSFRFASRKIGWPYPTAVATRQQPLNVFHDWRVQHRPVSDIGLPCPCNTATYP
jgi:hypothetical protein